MVGGTQPPGQFSATDVGHRDVEQNDLWRLLGNHGEGDGGIGEQIQQYRKSPHSELQRSIRLLRACHRQVGLGGVPEKTSYSKRFNLLGEKEM